MPFEGNNYGTPDTNDLGHTNCKQSASKINGPMMEKVSKQMEEHEGLDLIEKLQTHENTEVYNKALAIIDRYFSEEQDSDVEVAPQATNKAFQFGAPQDVPLEGFYF